MRHRLLISILATVLALGVLAVPALAQDDPTDEPATAETSQSGADDTSAPEDVPASVDDGLTDCDDTTSFDDDTSTDDDAGTRAVVVAAGDDDPSGDDGDSDDLGPDDDPCATDDEDTGAELQSLGSDVSAAVPGSIAVASLLSKGTFSTVFAVPGKATIDAQLYSVKGLLVPASKLHGKVKLAKKINKLGSVHKVIASATDAAKVNVKLSPLARKAVKALKKKTKVQLRTTIKLAGGTTVNKTWIVTLSSTSTRASN